MQKLGIDFGTTNSILSYYDGKRVETFKHGGAHSTPYIPSVLSVENDSGHMTIGAAARLHLGDSDYRVYSHFKMLLAEQDAAILKQRGFADLSPQHVAQQYIGHLLHSFQQEMNAPPPEKVVITVPEIWVREGRHAAREALKGICKNLQLPHYKMLSEPQAATVYFADRYQAKHGKAFNGHVLVCDYGGGTLDLSLSQVSGDTITILEGTGKGRDMLGAAGVAFDEAAVRRVLEKEISAKQFYRLVKDFEEHKIGLVDKIGKSLERYRKNPATDKKIFEIGTDTKVKTSDLDAIFNELIAPPLQQALEEMQSCLSRHSIDTHNGEVFRVVMVGGFSNFYLVQKTVRDFFQSKTAADPRFDTCFTQEDTALAISKGAALVANGVFDVEQACPISIGVQVKNSHLEDVDVVCLEKGKPITGYFKAHYCTRWLEVLTDNALDTTSLTIFLDVAHGKRRYLDLQGRLRDFLPNPHKDNKWQLGFSVDDDLIFTLHAKDKKKQTSDLNLGLLQEKISGLHISEK
jgi:molecular chaperone DnaK